MNQTVNVTYEPEVVVDTADLSREDWLAYRRLGIGGSDVAAIMGISPFATIRDLYNDKTGVLPLIDEEESNWVAKEVGHRLEDLVAEIFSRKTGLKYSRYGRCSAIRCTRLCWQMWIFSLSFRMAPLGSWSARPVITMQK